MPPGRWVVVSHYSKHPARGACPYISNLSKLGRSGYGLQMPQGRIPAFRAAAFVIVWAPLEFE
jgi:hypothetical protein